MSQFSWESVVAEEAQPQQQPAEPTADPGAWTIFLRWRKEFFAR